MINGIFATIDHIAENHIPIKKIFNKVFHLFF